MTPQQAAQQAHAAHIPVSAVSVGTADGVVQQTVKGGYTEQIQVPVKPDGAAADRRDERRPVRRGRASVDVRRRRTSSSARASGHKRQGGRGDIGRSGRRAGLHARRRAPLRRLVPEARREAARSPRSSPRSPSRPRSRRGRRDERVQGHPGVHPRARAVGGRAAERPRRSTCSRCPGGRSIVGGLDAQATSRAVRVGFDGRLGAPVAPGVTTTRNALFHAVSTAKRPQAFQPLLGCVPRQGGGGRSTVSARVVTPAGPPLELPVAHRRASARVRCGPRRSRARRARSSSARGTRSRSATKKPPHLGSGSLVDVTQRIVVGKQVVATASATDALSIDAHAVVQVGAECAP